MTKTVIVTGGAGFIGSAVCRHLIGSGNYRVINLDLLTYAGNLESLKSVCDDPNYRFVQGDIRDRDAVLAILREEQADAIMHLAAESHVDRSITGSGAFVRTNVLGTHALLEAARGHYDRLDGEAKERFRFLHVSTDEVFGSLGDEGFFTEDTAYDPRSPYSASKKEKPGLPSQAARFRRSPA